MLPTISTLFFNNNLSTLHVLVDFSNIYPTIDENTVLIVTKFPVASKFVSNIDKHVAPNVIEPIIIKNLQLGPSPFIKILKSSYQV